MTAASWIDEFDPPREHPAMFEHFERTVLELCEVISARDILEIGGGRSPLFSGSEFRASDTAYHINDISASELAATPDTISTSNRHCFDVAATDHKHQPTFDLVYSKSVLEHVGDGAAAWQNSYNLLRPGGVAFHFFPTLYAAPFVMNRVLPDQLTERAMTPVTGLTHVKFPAKYDYCTATNRTHAMIESAGFRHVRLIPFWGHIYFERIPVLREIEGKLTRVAASRGWYWYSSYCFAFAVK